MRILIPGLLVSACFAVVPDVSWAQAQAPSPAGGATVSNNDANQIICEKLQVIGSRLAVKKVCMTRSQWTDARFQDRAVIEKVQQQRALIGEASGGAFGGVPCIAGRGTHC